MLEAISDEVIRSGAPSARRSRQWILTEKWVLMLTTFICVPH
ncbi:hypothetical protein C1A50_2146 [Paenibacillus polymyxa]|nr:hypothetical protein C1A50_2146 [Paenibacillus polymyxa]